MSDSILLTKNVLELFAMGESKLYSASDMASGMPFDKPLETSTDD